MWGLAAGDYVISANAGFASQTRDTDIARLTDADIKRAMSEVAAGAARPGGPSEAGADPDVRPRTVGYAAVFYPGTPVAAPGGADQGWRGGGANRRRLSHGAGANRTAWKAASSSRTA